VAQVTNEHLCKAILHNKFGALCIKARLHAKAIKHLLKAYALLDCKHYYTNLLSNLGLCWAALK